MKGVTAVLETVGSLSASTQHNSGSSYQPNDGFSLDLAGDRPATQTWVELCFGYSGDGLQATLPSLGTQGSVKTKVICKTEVIES